MTLVHTFTTWSGCSGQHAAASAQETSTLASIGRLLSMTGQQPMKTEDCVSFEPSFSRQTEPEEVTPLWASTVTQLASLAPPLHADAAELARHKAAVANTILHAARLALADPKWLDSGISQHLERAATVCGSQGPEAARQLALGLLDFQRIVLRSTSPPRPGVRGQVAGQGTVSAPPPAGAQALPALTSSGSGQRVIVMSGNRLSINTQGGIRNSNKAAVLPAHRAQAGNLTASNTFPAALKRLAPDSQPASPKEPMQPQSPPLLSEDSRPLKKRCMSQFNRQASRMQLAATSPASQPSMGKPQSGVESAGQMHSIDSASQAGFSGEAAKMVHELWCRNQQASTGGEAPSDDTTPVEAAAQMLNNKSVAHNSLVDFHQVTPESALPSVLPGQGEVEVKRDMRKVHWGGKVKHKLGGSTVELFYMTALIPEAYIDRFPPAMFVSALVQRKTIKLSSNHQPLRCRLDFLTTKQVDKLKMLASLGLATVCSLQHCSVTLVPYLGEGKALRVMGFLLADP